MCHSTAAEYDGLQFDHVHVFSRTVLYRMVVAVCSLFARTTEVGSSCSYRWWRSWLCHDTAIESDGVQFDHTHVISRTVLFSVLVEVAASYMRLDWS